MFIHRLLVVREDQNISLYSIHCNPSNSNEFCVSGDSFCVRVYDRRNVSKPLYQLWSRYDMVRWFVTILLLKNLSILKEIEQYLLIFNVSFNFTYVI